MTGEWKLISKKTQGKNSVLWDFQMPSKVITPLLLAPKASPHENAILCLMMTVKSPGKSLKLY